MSRLQLSVLTGWSEENGIMTITSTLQAIDKKILALGYGVISVDIATTDTQESYDGGVLVLVTVLAPVKEPIPAPVVASKDVADVKIQHNPTPVESKALAVVKNVKLIKAWEDSETSEAVNKEKKKIFDVLEWEKSTDSYAASLLSKGLVEIHRAGVISMI